MQILIELIAGLVAMLAAAALSGLGVDISDERPSREVRRVEERPVDRPPPQKAVAVITAPETRQDC